MNPRRLKWKHQEVLGEPQGSWKTTSIFLSIEPWTSSLETPGSVGRAIWLLENHIRFLVYACVRPKHGPTSEGMEISGIPYSNSSTCEFYIIQGMYYILHFFLISKPIEFKTTLEAN